MQNYPLTLIEKRPEIIPYLKYHYILSKDVIRKKTIVIKGVLLN